MPVGRHAAIGLAGMRMFGRALWDFVRRGISFLRRLRANSRGRAIRPGLSKDRSSDTAARLPLDREPTTPLHLSRLCRDTYRGKVILISGAGGSIGSALARHMVSCRPAHIVLFELNEFALYEIDRMLSGAAQEAGVKVTPVLGSVAEPRTVRRVLERHGVDIVLHAAAYKHVPLVETNPMVGLVNNVFGTQTLAEQAAHAGVARFILLSTDKAVRPANVMGASKRLAERVVLDLSRREGQQTVFSVVRFGNVLGSSGSVVPLFREQLAQGGPLTVTHPEVARYVMTLEQALQMVLEGGAMARGGEVFISETGPPVRISALARQMIEEAGKTPNGDRPGSDPIGMVFTGLRAGEKLREELSLSGIRHSTNHPMIFTVDEPILSHAETAAALRALKEAFMANNEELARAAIARWVEPLLENDPPDALRRSS